MVCFAGEQCISIDRMTGSVEWMNAFSEMADATFENCSVEHKVCPCHHRDVNSGKPDASANTAVRVPANVRESLWVSPQSPSSLSRGNGILWAEGEWHA